MDRGIYAASSAGLLGVRKLDAVAENLANVNTVGFKAQKLLARQQNFEDTLASKLDNQTGRERGDHDRTPGVVHVQTTTDFSPGPVSFTGNNLDVALQDPRDFFVVQTPQGPQYTRAGNFQLDAEGQIVTSDGMPVMGEGGLITVTGGQPLISPTGAVLVNNQPVGTLRRVRFQDPQLLQREAGTRFSAPRGAAPQPSEEPVVPGSLEMSNVGTVQSMVEMINAHKSFESYAKSVQTISELNEVNLRTVRSL